MYCSIWSNLETCGVIINSPGCKGEQNLASRLYHQIKKKTKWSNNWQNFRRSVLDREVKIIPESSPLFKGKGRDALFILNNSLGSCLLSGEQRMPQSKAKYMHFSWVVMKRYRDRVFSGYGAIKRLSRPRLISLLCHRPTLLPWSGHSVCKRRILLACLSG